MQPNIISIIYNSIERNIELGENIILCMFITL